MCCTGVRLPIHVIGSCSTTTATGWTLHNTAFSSVSDLRWMKPSSKPGLLVWQQQEPFTPMLACFHCFPDCFRINLKMLLFVFKSLKWTCLHKLKVLEVHWSATHGWGDGTISEVLEVATKLWIEPPPLSLPKTAPTLDTSQLKTYVHVPWL